MQGHQWEQEGRRSCLGPEDSKGPTSCFQGSQLTRQKVSRPVDAGMFCSVLRLFQGGVIGIKIGWVCDLDRADDQCNPSYSFTRLDAMSQKNAVSPGYNFRSLLPNSVHDSVCVVWFWSQ